MAAALLFTVPGWGPLAHPNFAFGKLYDGTSHLSRAYFLRELLTHGDWYPRWVPQEYGGYGYPTFNFYSPLTYYLTVGSAALLPDSSIYTALQALSAGSAVLVVVAVYGLGWQLWRHAPVAALAATAFAYSP